MSAEPICPSDCGKCCDPVVSMHAPNELRILHANISDEALADRQFMLDHCTPLPRREGLRRAPYLSDSGHSLMLARDAFGGMHMIDAWSHFYECDRFDKDTRQCTDYANRPPMCRDYPLYGDTLTSKNHALKRLPDGCVYLPGAPVPVKVLPPKVKRRNRTKEETG